MRTLRVCLLAALLTGVAGAHGESGRSQPGNAGTPTIVVPAGGPTDSPTGPRGGPTTVRAVESGHTWDVWWAYHREWILATRLRRRPTSGVRMPREQNVTRRNLREGELLDVMLGALEDKHHDVRAAAAIALGKFGLEKAATPLARHTHHPPEGWFDVREAAVYGAGILGLEGNRRFLLTIANDKERSIKERSLALPGLLVDGSEASADELEARLKYFRSGIHSKPDVLPVHVEQEHRRFSAHLLGFVETDRHDAALGRAAAGGRPWKDGERGLAITALGRRRARDYKSDLFRYLYERDAGKDVHRSAAIALGLMLEPGDEDDIGRLERFVRDSKRDPIAQHFGVMALANIGGDKVVGILDGFLDRNTFADETDRAFVYLALGLVGERSASARDTLLLRYERARTRKEQSVLAVACGLARVPGAARRTEELLARTSPSGGADRSGDFLAWGSLALGLHGVGADTLREIFRKYNDPLVRENAAIALCLVLGKAAVPELVEILREAGTQHARAAVVTALGVLPEPTREAVDALVEVYKDDSVGDAVRAMAIIALGALGDPRPVPLSAQLTRHYNYFIRCIGLDEVASFL